LFRKRIIFVFSSVLFLMVFSNAASGQIIKDIYELSLYDLIKLPVSSGASLTKTEVSKIPASVTLITRRMIAESGARNLDELLEIYIPSFYRLRQSTSPDFGMRGIIHSRDNKTLLLVNGRIMNHRTLLGAISERFLPLLGDIESIEVVRGPGSAVYGPGAINGVININTDTNEALNGLSASTGNGIIEEYTSGQLRIRKTFGSRLNLSAYFGIAEYQGADPADAPLVFSVTESIGSENLFTAGVPVDSGIVNDNRAMEDRDHYKAHIQLESGNSRIWARMVRGSTQFLQARSTIESVGTLEKSKIALMYQQLTYQAEHMLDAGRNFDMHFRISYDIHDLIRNNHQVIKDQDYQLAIREKELNLRQLTSWTPHPSHSVAAGIEYSREWFGEDPGFLTEDIAHLGTKNFTPWTTNTIGILGEYQWNMGKAWTLFLGGRADRHSFTDRMYSPKASIIFTPTDRYTSKLLYNQSVRKSEDNELKDQNDKDLEGETEKIKSFEFRQDLLLREGLTLSVIGLWYQLNSIGWISNRGAIPIGMSEVGGLETELAYSSSSHNIAFSYSFNKLQEYKLADESINNQLESSAPYGYGNDLQNWPRHISKLIWRWQATKKLSTISSVRFFWGYQGAQAYAEYNNEVLKQNHISKTEDGRTDAFEGSALLNIGFNYNIGRGVNLAVHTHNILGWLQHDFNKRNFFARMAGYRSEAPALSFNLRFDK
ncbi:TonB-dependent receptor plug domain-containing protein, partial [candidate division KSB1 bacterium]